MSFEALGGTLRGSCETSGRLLVTFGDSKDLGVLEEILGSYRDPLVRPLGDV